MAGPAALVTATDAVLSAALLGTGWENALQLLADSVQADGGATLVYTEEGQSSAVICNPELAGRVGRYLAGECPRDPRAVRVRTSVAGGFRTDYDDFEAEEIERDPFYQEFLRPCALYWHATARLVEANEIDLGIKRSNKSGYFEPEAIAKLNRELPDLRAAVRIAQASQSQRTNGMIDVLEARGKPVLQFDFRGRVRHDGGEAGNGSLAPLTLRRRMLSSSDMRDQRAIDAAVQSVVSGARRAASVVLRCASAMGAVLQIIRVKGDACDVFGATAAVGVLIRGSAHTGLTADQVGQIGAALELTSRELQLAALLAQGKDLRESALKLGVAPSTAKSHLDRLFDKSGTRRQAELIALLVRLIS